jgi:O-antigen ligase
MNSKANNISYKVKPSAVKLLLLTPLIVTLYFNTRAQDPFNTPKLIILLLTSSWLLGHLLISYRKYFPDFFSKDFEIILVVIFLVSILVAFFFSEVKITALIGDNLRRLGVLTYAAMAIILLIAARVMTFYSSLKLIKIAVLTGFLSSIYGLIQMTGNDPVSWNNPYNSIITTMGNPNFASAAMAILSLIAFFSLFLSSLSKSFRLFSVLTILFSLIAIYNSQSRQGILTLIFGIIFYFGVYIFINFPRFKFITLTTLLAASLMLIAGMLQKGPLAAYLYKESVSVRGYYWRAAIEMFKDNPLFGVGLDNYGGYFKQYREVEYVTKYGFDITSSNAHNVILQLFSTGGLFVGISYCALQVFTIFIGLKLVKNTSGELQKISLLFLSAWIGYQAQAFISIDNMGLTIWGWIIAGSIFGLFKRLDLNNPLTENNLRVTASRKVGLDQTLVSSLIVIPSFVVSMFLWQAESDAFSIRSLQGLNQYKDVLNRYVDELEQNPLGDPFYKFESYRLLAESGDTQSSIPKIRILLESEPRNLFYLQWLAWFEQEQNDYNSAILTRERIVELDPWNAQNFLDLGILYKQIGDIESMNQMLQRIVSIPSGVVLADKARTELA